MWYSMKDLIFLIIDNPLIIDDIAVIGDVGWYDYSFKTEWVNDYSVLRKAYKGITWVDKKYIKWEKKKDTELVEIYLYIEEYTNFIG